MSVHVNIIDEISHRVLGLQSLALSPNIGKGHEKSCAGDFFQSPSRYVHEMHLVEMS